MSISLRNAAENMKLRATTVIKKKDYVKCENFVKSYFRYFFCEERSDK